MPVVDVETAAEFYRDRLGFTIASCGDGFAKLLRDDVELRLWQADDQGWKGRADLDNNLLTFYRRPRPQSQPERSNRGHIGDDAGTRLRATPPGD